MADAHSALTLGESLLDELGTALNYFAFVDEKWPGLFNVEFGGGEEILVTLGMIQTIISELYDAIEENGVIA